MTEADKLGKVQATQEKAELVGLTLKLMTPHLEGDVFTLQPTEETLQVADWRDAVDLSEISSAFPTYEVKSRNVVAIDLDKHEPTLDAKEVLTGGTPDPFDRNYSIGNKIIVGDGEKEYNTSYDKMIRYLRSGQRGSMPRIPATSRLQRHAIGTAQGGDLDGRTVFTDYRVIATEDIDTHKPQMLVDGVMLYGEPEKVTDFLEKMAKTPYPPAQYSEPAYDRKTGLATW